MNSSVDRFIINVWKCIAERCPFYEGGCARLSVRSFKLPAARRAPPIASGCFEGASQAVPKSVSFQQSSTSETHYSLHSSTMEIYRGERPSWMLLVTNKLKS